MLSGFRIEVIDCSVITTSNHLIELLRQGHLNELNMLKLAGFSPTLRAIEAMLADVSQCLVAFQALTPIGLLALVPDHDNRQTMISLLIVDEAFQRQGIAKQLVTQALHLVRTPLAALATTVNIPAISLYYQMGFTPDWIGTVTQELPLMIRFKKVTEGEYLLANHRIEN